ncbi:MFS transporter [Spongorhabdus nitratireducens]
MSTPARQWQACLIYGVSSLFVGYQFIMQGAVGVMAQELMQTLALDHLQLGLLSCSFFYSYVLLQIPAGIAVDLYGPRRVLAFSLLLMGFSCLLFSQAETLLEATLARILAGTACAPGIVCTLYLGRHWFAARLFPLLLGIMEMVCMSGGATGDYLIPWLMEGTSWRHAMLVFAGLSMLLLLITWSVIRDAPAGVRRVTGRAGNLCLKPVLTNTAVWNAGIICGLMYAIISAFAALWSIPFLQQAYPGSGHFPAFAAGLIFLGAAVGAPACGALASQFGKSRPVIIGSAVISAILIITVLFWQPGESLTAGLLLLLGIASGGYVLPFALSRCIVDEAHQGVANGVINMVANALGTIALQPLIGWHLGQTEGLPVLADFQMSLVLLAFCPLAAMLLALQFRETDITDDEPYASSSGISHT